MKKLLSLTLVCLLTIFVCFGCVGGQERNAENGEHLIIYVNLEVEEGDTLLDYMNRINHSKHLTSFTIQNGMITSVNGAKAFGNVYWMIYTDDSEFSNVEWGSVTIDSATYYSASLGADDLPVKKGCSYVLYAQAF